MGGKVSFTELDLRSQAGTGQRQKGYQDKCDYKCSSHLPTSSYLFFLHFIKCI